MKYFYGILTILGFLLPYSQFIPWLYENGFNVTQLINEVSQSNISSFAWLDVIVAAIVLIGFILYDGKKKGMKHLYFPIIGTLTVGVSFGLPLFLFLREIHSEKKKQIK
ncbi:DUF2834 domain-containing protein [Alkalihalobacillus trypoxylicola]|uniref:DUF2834 domain-containing protein n=1 Tax=Alkalihalobacillus trypoxylicola TaxID=519424 RepID=A0A162CMT3_9BACI|nr:DUF2834 domain-containing protein [Alkalihalobacillus trypoxylicola]KYG25591.1 hypothetical protein AZF04_13975 [Alkalihalobacillus trypoxylicola]